MEPQRPSLLPMPMSARQTLAETNSRQHDLHFSRPQQLPQDVDRLHHLPSADLDSNGNLQGALPIAPTAILTQASSQVTPKRKRGKYSKAKCQQCRKDKKKVEDKFGSHLASTVTKHLGSAHLLTVPGLQNAIIAYKGVLSVLRVPRPQKNERIVTLYLYENPPLRQIRH